ncbi:MAG: serine protease, partial [Clostridia bacterium]|nr:serine protease [Clostridia bacterium]
MDNFENENNFTDKEETLDDQNQGSTPAFENPDLTAVPQEPEMPAFSQTPEAVEEPAADPYNTEPQFSGFGQSSGQFSQTYAPPVYEAQQKVEFYNESAVNSDNKKKPASKGLKAFAAILAVVLLMTVSCTVGYNLGRRKTTSKSLLGTTSMKVYPKPADTDEMTAQEVYDKLNDSIVGIIVYNEDGSASQASGVVYTDNEYILTNDHIYSTIGAPKFKVYTSKGEVLEAEYVAGDTISDLALIKVKNATGLKAPQYGDSSELKFGENVVAIGRPGDARTDSSISTGIISNPNRRAQ